MKLILNITLFLFVINIYGQRVGINTSNPQAKLDINAQPNGLPALQINPQSTPVGSVNGELTVIGDKLYLYSLNRKKWLSAETSMYSFAEDGNAETRLEYTGDVERTGPIIPIDATIVEINVRAANATVNKRIQLHINGIAVPNNDANPSIDGALALDNNSEFYTNTYNLNINRGDILTVTQSGVGLLRDVTVDIILKWRK